MQSEDGFKFLCNINELKDGRGKRFFIDDCDVAVFKVDNKIYALNNICPHQKSAIIFDGIIEDEKISCPAHGWQFNLSNGCYADGRKGLDVHQIKLIGDKVFIKVVKKDYNW